MSHPCPTCTCGMKDGDRYWFVNDYLDVARSLWADDWVDRKRRAPGNFFLTEVKAIEACDRIRQVLEEMRDK